MSPLSTEALLILVSWAAFLQFDFVRRAFEAVRAPFDRLAERPLLAMAAVGLFAGPGSALWALFTRVPVPDISDEFGYLLMADTFAHGRLANPTHPEWVHFENIHIFHQPTYAAKYPPAQGLILAVGQVAFGQPAAGLWIGAALACAALCWMLYAWAPRRWALLGGLIVATRSGVISYWSQSYFGGWMATLGGALVFGALRRIESSPRARYGILLGLGLSILAASRPYEGLLVSLPVPVVLLGWLWRGGQAHGPERRRLLSRVCVPLVLVLPSPRGFWPFTTCASPALPSCFPTSSTIARIRRPRPSCGNGPRRCPRIGTRT